MWRLSSKAAVNLARPIALTLVVAVVASACADSSPTSDTGETAGTTTMVTSLTTLTTARSTTDSPPDADSSSEADDQNISNPMLPLVTLFDSLELSESQHLARELARQECMNDRGWEYTPAPYLPSNLALDRRYGIVDEEAAALYGYAPPPSGRDETSLFNSVQNEYYFGLSVADQHAYSAAEAGEGYGDGEIKHIYLNGAVIASGTFSGCYSVAWDATVGDQIAWIKLHYWLQELMQESYSLAESDPRVQQARSNWRTCMEAAGQSVTSLTAPPFEPDNDVAVADARCNNASALAPTWLQVDSEVQYTLIAEHETELDELFLMTGLE